MDNEDRLFDEAELDLDRGEIFRGQDAEESPPDADIQDSVLSIETKLGSISRDVNALSELSRYYRDNTVLRRRVTLILLELETIKSELAASFSIDIEALIGDMYDAVGVSTEPKDDASEGDYEDEELGVEDSGMKKDTPMEPPPGAVDSSSGKFRAKRPRPRYPESQGSKGSDLLGELEEMVLRSRNKRSKKEHKNAVSGGQDSAQMRAIVAATKKLMGAFNREMRRRGRRKRGRRESANPTRQAMVAVVQEKSGEVSAWLKELDSKPTLEAAKEFASLYETLGDVVQVPSLVENLVSSGFPLHAIEQTLVDEGWGLLYKDNTKLVFSKPSWV